VVTTTADLETYVRALAHGELFQKPETLTAMMPTKGQTFGLGMITYDVDGQLLWGHGGGWGTVMLYEPAFDTAYTATINQVYGDLRGVVVDVLHTVNEHRSK